MLVAMIVWFVLGAGFIIYSLVTQCEYFLSFCAEVEGAAFSDFVMVGGVLHLGLWLLAIWGVCMLFLIPKVIFEWGEGYNLVPCLLVVGVDIALICVVNSYLGDMNWFLKIIIFVIVSVLGNLVVAPLYLIGMTQEINGMWVLSLVLIFILFLLLVFVLFTVYWFMTAHPILSLLILLAGLALVGGGGYGVYAIIFVEE